MNTAYIIALIALVLGLAFGFLGCGMAVDNDRAMREAAPWLLAPACALLVTAVIFAGVGVDLQYA